MQTLSGIAPIFGGGSSGAPTGTGMGATMPPTILNGVTDPINAPSSPAVTNLSAIDGSSPSTGGNPTDAQLLALMQQQQQLNPYLAGIEALGPVGAALLQQRNNWQLGGQARPAQPSTQQPGPLQITPEQQPGSPLATAALIAQLL